MPRAADQRHHYDDLVRSNRSTRYGLSCGYEDRFDPALLSRRPPLRRALADLFDRILPLRIRTLVDVGCGTAYYWPLLVRRCQRVVGIELSEAMARQGHRSWFGSTTTMLVGQERKLPLRSGAADVVLAVDALHHIESLDRLIAEAYRLLIPGGRFVALEPNILNPLVFFAHMVPPEERGALWPNHPVRVSRALKRQFGASQVRCLPVTYISGVDSPVVLAGAARLNGLLSFWPARLFSLRRVYIARRPR